MTLMMITTQGVHINEINTFPNSIVPALSADLVEKYQPEYYLVAQAPHSSL